MSGDSERFQAAIARIDAANAEDPNRESCDGKTVAKERLYSERMSRWLDRLAPDAPEALRLAARAQHIRRWTIPRADYPMDRRGYHRWRTDLARFHAEEAGAILRDVGYDEATVARVQALILKKRLKSDPEAQLLEDVICLVFLESYFAAFATGHDEEKVLAIIRKTWKKMSPRGHEAALALDLPAASRAMIDKALAP